MLFVVDGLWTIVTVYGVTQDKIDRTNNDHPVRSMLASHGPSRETSPRTL